MTPSPRLLRRKLRRPRLRPWTLMLCVGLTAEAAAAQPAPTLEELVEVTDLSGLSASPDGRHVLFRSERASLDRNAYDLTWHVADLYSGEVRSLGTAGEAIFADPGVLVAERPIWSPDQRHFYYRALRSGSVQVWRTSLEGDGEAITSEPGDVVALEPAPDGRSLRLRVGPDRAEIERAELAEYDNGILIDEHVEIGQNLFRGAIINGRRASQRLTGLWFARGGILWSRGATTRLLNLDSLTLSAPAEEAAPAPASPPPDLSAASERGDVAEARWDGEAGSLQVRRRSGAIAHCRHAICLENRLAWIAWRPGHDELVFATADQAHVQRLYRWAPGTNRVRSLAVSDGLLNGGRDAASPCAITPEEAICVASGPVSPPRLERLDLGSGDRNVLFDPNPTLRARAWPRAERLQWSSADGRQFTGVLFMPRAERGRVPLFLNYYRCQGFLRGGEGDEWPLAILAADGIATVCVNATRMTGPQDGVGQYRWALAGIGRLIDQLEARGLIDRTRVGMGGLSFGSEVTMWAVMHSDLIAAASVASPQFEPANYWLNGVRGRDHHRVLRDVWGLGAPEETPDQWRLLSPALNVERIRAPLLMQLSEQESRYAMELYARLSNSTTPAEMYVYPEEPHIKVQPRHRLAVYRRNFDWFRFWLQGQVDDDPTRAEQYRRWRALAARSGRSSPLEGSQP